MQKKLLFWETFALVAAMGVLNYFATYFHLYWKYVELDSVTHFLGGAAAASFFIWLYFYSGFFSPTNRDFSKFLLVSIFGAMFVGVAWEIFEVVLGETSLNKSEYPFDTTLDFIMDFLGALAICFYGYLKETKSEARSTKSETNYEQS